MTEPLEPAPSRCPVPHQHAALPAMPDGMASGACPVTGATSPLAAPEPEAPRWAPGTREATESSARQTADASHLEAERAAAMAVRAAEARAGRTGLDEIGDQFVRVLGRKLGYGHPLSDRSGVAEFTWSEAAEARLAEVPAFCRELTRWRVEWTAHKLGLGTTITPEIMAAKYEMWGKVSHAIQQRERERLPWTDSARARFARVPDFVQGQVLEAVEGNARSLGAAVVDDATVDLVIRKWSETGDFHEGLYGFK